MAELAKKLNIKKNGATTTCKIYSTDTEAGSSYVSTIVNNVAAYIPLVATNDGRASLVRVDKNGSTQSIATTGKPPYTEKNYTTPGTFTFTVPSGVTRIRIAVCGGGGGGANNDSNSSKTAGSGGTSSVKSGAIVLIQATGGGGGVARYDYNDGNKGNGGSAGAPNGRAGTSAFGAAVSDTVGFALGFTKANGTYGSGGGCNLQYISVSSGGSGGFNSNYISVSGGKTLTITVGAGGSKYDYNGRGYPRDGKAGFCKIAYGGDI